VLENAKRLEKINVSREITLPEIECEKLISLTVRADRKRGSAPTGFMQGGNIGPIGKKDRPLQGSCGAII